MKPRVVYTTVPNLEVAQEISRTLVKEQWAACVNRIGPVHSTYEWQGELCEEEEFLLMLKTHEGLLEGLTQRLNDLHPYEVPEIIALPIEYGLETYLNWIKAQTKDTL